MLRLHIQSKKALHITVDNHAGTLVAYCNTTLQTCSHPFGGPTQAVTFVSVPAFKYGLCESLYCGNSLGTGWSCIGAQRHQAGPGALHAGVHSLQYSELGSKGTAC